jgi:hypothetical protein
LIFNRSGLQVAIVDRENRIVIKPIKISRDLGSEVEIASGIGAEDRIVINPPDGVVTGDQVRVAGEAGTPGGPATASAK